MSAAPSNTNTKSNANGQSSLNNWEAAAESCVRVSLAGFAGSLIGLAKERQSEVVDLAQSLSHERQQRHVRASRGTDRGQARPRRPPSIPVKTASTNLPMMWSLSCVMFALVLESSRRASPTDLVWKVTTATTTESATVPSADSVHSQPTTFSDLALRKAVVSIGDYAIGGTAAGLAGAYGQQRQRMANRSLTVRSGLLTGLGLGLLAGTLQAVIDVAHLYLSRSDTKSDEPEQRQEDMES